MVTSVADRSLGGALTEPSEDSTGTAGRSPRWLRFAGLVALAIAVAGLGAARWNGQVPFGSDNDEYQLVARQLLHLDAPVVAGIEGTKYPLGYPALLAAIDAVGLPVVDASLLLNVVLVGVAAALAGAAARHRGPAAAVAAAATLLLARPLWAVSQSMMPDVAFTAAVAAAFVVAGRATASRRAVVVLTLLALAATSLKSVGLLVGVAASVSLLCRVGLARRGRLDKEAAFALLPAASALGLTAATAAVVGRYPEHTTGYARTFWLVDPYDAAGGDASVVDVAGRVPDRIDLVLDDAARALWGELVHGPPAWALTIALVVVGVAAARTSAARSFVATFVVLDLVALAVWPYSSDRFGLPLVPIAAVGVGAVVAALARRLRLTQPVAVGAATAVALALVVLALPTLRREANREGDTFAELDAARREVVAWLPPGARPVSADYRELASVRPYGTAVLPLAYTSDADALLDQAAPGTHLVVLQGVYGARDALVARLLAAHADRFELVHDTDRADVYVIRP